MAKKLLYRTIPHYLLEVLAKYFRVEVEGAEHLPKTGPVILIPNHSGFIGLDALLLSHWICKNHGRVPRILLHKLWFEGGLLRRPAKELGFVEASYADGVSALDKKKILMLFPEGEQGNFKPTKDRYRLRNFRKGFVKMAVETGAPIVPVLILGAEESNINLGQLKVFRQTIPLPLNYFPFPAKWKIKFLPPVQIPKLLALEEDHQVEEYTSGIRAQMQTELHNELSQRKYIYFDNMI